MSEESTKAKSTQNSRLWYSAVLCCIIPYRIIISPSHPSNENKKKKTPPTYLPKYRHLPTVQGQAFSDRTHHFKFSPVFKDFGG
ncbi:hypothetical protein L873DRAFT_1796859 [Choiromyces venosus 120613-1]|uniref:Uncharacterized protein n=1 Tax=Choiromyces venosus 120613-1 TaxID=1336337 RepID=A0A3N4K612_9PEZI|nr:hypothetical protein L873DRAFT_1796859 [Choiromyces venosus 120613-1]